ncbi:MAG TPA: hypothetical protein VLF89_01155 [Candidatus Saccharimonadales bacterium]|nr:hypothetical protein [Candidatus Saccharimonadales bacterium]
MNINMIDTIGLSITHGKYSVFDPTVFIPTFRRIDEIDQNQVIQFLKDKKGLQKYTLNPKSSLKELGFIYPNVTIYESYKRNNYQCNLKPHISIPKMLFGHSVEEVTNKHYEQAVTMLQDRLKEMQVLVYEKALQEATVTTLNYCMNVLVQSDAEARRLLNALNRMSLGERYENHSRDYANNGKAVRFHTKTFELIFYLKYYDFIQTGNDRIDKKTTPQEKAIAQKLLEANTIPPLIRIEVRFNGKPSIRQHLRTINGIDKPTWTLKEVFDEEISRKVIQYYWHKLTDNQLNKLMLMEISDEYIYRKLRENFISTPQRILDNTIGMLKRLQAQGVVNYKEELLRSYSRSKWYKDQQRIVEFLDKNNLLQNSDLYEFMENAVTQKPMQLGLPI